MRRITAAPEPAITSALATSVTHTRPVDPTGAAPERARSADSGLSPLTQARTLLRLMQLNSLAQRQAGRIQPHTTGLGQRLADLIQSLPIPAQQPLIDELTDADWAEPDLISRLCRLPMPAPAAMIRRSPVLRDADLLPLTTDEDRAPVAARRTYLSAAVMDALIDAPSPDAAIALLHNDALHPTAEQFERLVTRARDHIALREPLVRHRDLTREAASRLLGFAGPRLKDILMARFAQLYARDFVTPPPRDAAQTLQALSRGDFPGFRSGLSHLTGILPDEIDRCLRQDSLVPLALLMVIAGMDRAALPGLLTPLQALNDGHPRVSSGHIRFVRTTFDLSPAEARSRLSAASASPPPVEAGLVLPTE
ncbi:MAG: DUF2336 domain-containing protein [Asticcacaulis sp.]